MTYAPGINFDLESTCRCVCRWEKHVSGNVGVKIHVDGNVGVKICIRGVKTYVRGVKIPRRCEFPGVELDV